MRRSWTLALVVLPVVAACGGGRAPEAAVPPAAPSPAITPADLKLRSAIFADDSMLGRRAGTVGNVSGNAYIAGELARLGLKPAGDSGGFLQRVPLTSYALDTARTALRAGASALAAFSDFYPYQPTFAVPVRPINGAQLVYVGAPADSAAWPTREALQGKLVVFRSAGDGQSIGAPNLGPQGPFGQVAGIAVTHIDPLIGQFGDYLRAPRVEVKAGDQAPPGVTQPRMLFVPDGVGREALRQAARRAQAGRGRPDGAGRRRLRGQGSPGDERRGGARRLRPGAPRRVRRARRAQRRDRHRGRRWITTASAPTTR